MSSISPNRSSTDPKGSPLLKGLHPYLRGSAIAPKNGVNPANILAKNFPQLTTTQPNKNQPRWTLDTKKASSPSLLFFLRSIPSTNYPFILPNPKTNSQPAPTKKNSISLWGRVVGPSAQEREQYLKEFNSKAPEGLLKRFLGKSLSYTTDLMRKPFGLAFRYCKNTVDRAAFFYQGQGFLQDKNQKEALLEWYKTFRSTYARPDQLRNLPDISDSTGLTDTLFKELQTAVMVELNIDPDTFDKKPAGNSLLTSISKVLPQASLLRGILPEANLYSQPMEQALPLDILDKIEALVKNPYMREASLLIALPALHSLLEKLQNLSLAAPQLKPHLEKVHQNFDRIKKALESSPDQVAEAFATLRNTLKSLPAVSIEGVRIFSGVPQQPSEIAPPIACAVSDDDLISHSFRPKTVAIAKEITDGSVLKFIKAFSGFSTVSIVNLFLDKTESKYDYASILESAETALAGSREVKSKDIIHQLQKKIKEDPTVGWFKRFVFGSKWILQFFFWFSEILVSSSAHKTVAELRTDLEQLKEHREAKNMLLFELVNKSLSNMVGMYQYVGEAKPGQDRISGSLERVMEQVSDNPIFYKGLSEKEMKTKVANKIVSNYLPKVELEGGFLKMIKGIPGESLLKRLSPVVRLLDYFPNKLITWFSGKLLKQTDAVGLIIESVTTKRERSTQLELTIYRSLHEELARAYHGMKNPVQNEQSPTLLRNHEMKEIQSLCNHLLKVSRLKRFTTADQVRDYFQNPPLGEKAEAFLIEKNKEILNELFIGIYKSITNDISIETQLNSIFDSAIASVEMNETLSQESLQKQIASERSSIDRLMHSILQISIDRGLDAALSPKPLQTESMRNIQEILSLSSVKEQLRRLEGSQNPQARKNTAIQIDTMIRSMTRHISLLLEQESKTDRLAPQDKALLLTRLKDIHQQLQSAFALSSEMRDHFIAKTLTFNPVDILTDIAQIRTDLSPIPSQNTPTAQTLLRVELRLKRLKEVTVRHSSLLSQFSKGPNLLQDLHNIYEQIDNHIKHLKTPNAQEIPNLEALGSLYEKVKGWCENYAVFSSDDTRDQHLLGLQELFKENSPICKLADEPLEKQEVEISFLKDSALVDNAKQRLTNVLKGYLDEVINHLTDPMVHKVAVKTVLGDFAK